MDKDNINCLSARRIISTDINHPSASLVEHLNDCSTCKAFYDRQRAFNHKLKLAAEVDVPEGLAARILVEHKLNQKKAKSVTNRWVAMAASIMLVVSVSVVTSLHTTPALAETIVEHIHEDVKMLETKGHFTPVQLNKLLNPHGVNIHANMGHARSAGNCLIEGQLSAHIVFKGKNAPVTMIVVPQRISNDRIEFAEQEMVGLLVNMPRGTLALVSTDKESLKVFEKHLTANLVASL
jgi:hypothetical protein